MLSVLACRLLPYIHSQTSRMDGILGGGVDFVQDLQGSL